MDWKAVVVDFVVVVIAVIVALYIIRLLRL
jgi:hypothetical protein